MAERPKREVIVFHKADDIKKFNPYHGSDGKFTTGAKATSFTYKPGAGSKYTSAIKREKERMQMPKNRTVSECKNFDELDETLKKRYFFSEGIDASVKRDCDFEMVKEFSVGFSKIMDKHPNMRGFVDVLDTYPAAISGTTGRILSVNPKFFSDRDAMDKEIKQQIEQKNTPSNTTIEAIGAHEGAHCLVFAMLFGRDDLESVDEIRSAWDSGLIPNEIVTKAEEKVKNTPECKGKTTEQLRSEISLYALQNNDETVAEAYADINANGKNAKPLSKQIEKEIDGIADDLLKYFQRYEE